MLLCKPYEKTTAHTIITNTGSMVLDTNEIKAFDDISAFPTLGLLILEHETGGIPLIAKLNRFYIAF